MLLFSPLSGFLILATLTSLSNAVPRDIHIYLHGLGNAGNKPRVEAGIAQTNAEARGEVDGQGNKNHDDDDCFPKWTNINSYKLLGPTITGRNRCFVNSPKFPSLSPIMPPIEPITGPNPSCSPPCSGESPFSLPWPKILPHFTPPPTTPKTPLDIGRIPWIKDLPRFTPPPLNIPGLSSDCSPPCPNPGCTPPCSGDSPFSLPWPKILPGYTPHPPINPTPPSGIDMIPWIKNLPRFPPPPQTAVSLTPLELPDCSPRCNIDDGFPMFTLPTAPPRIVVDHEPPPHNFDWNVDMPGCSPPCTVNSPPFKMPAPIMPKPGCTPPCSGDSDFPPWIYAFSGNEQEQHQRD